MQRFTISLDDALAAEFDRLIAERGYGNRSEAVRDLLRGPAQAVRRFADRVIAERGVRHGALNLVVADAAHEPRHADGTVHRHLKPRH